jgi:hypothetical protein
MFILLYFQVFSGMIRKSSEEKFSYMVIQKRPKPVVAGEKKKKGAAPVSNQARLFKDPKNHKAIRDGTVVAAPPFVDKKPIEFFGNWTIPMPVVDTPSSSSSSSSADNALDGRRTDPTPLAVLKRFAGIDKDDVQDVVDQLIDEVRLSHGFTGVFFHMLMLLSGRLGRIQSPSTQRGVRPHRSLPNQESRSCHNGSVHVQWPHHSQHPLQKQFAQCPRAICGSPQDHLGWSVPSAGGRPQ